MKKNLTKIIIVLIILFVLGIALAFESGRKQAREDNKTIIIYETQFYSLNRLRVNEYILENIVDDNYMIYDFYQRYTRDREMAVLIVNSAIAHDIPVNLMFALAFTESRFKKNALSKPNKNGTRDVGLFQLNNAVYNRYKQDYLLNINNNTRLAARHLLFNYEKYKSWEEALIAYNCGNTKKIPKSTLLYLRKVLRTEREIDYNLGVFTK